MSTVIFMRSQKSISRIEKLGHNIKKLETPSSIHESKIKSANLQGFLQLIDLKNSEPFCPTSNKIITKYSGSRA